MRKPGSGRSELPKIGKGMLSMWARHYSIIILKIFFDEDLQLILKFIEATQNNRKKT
jgi:hypothetical protein